MSYGTEIAGEHQKVGNWKQKWNETFIRCVNHCLAWNQEIIAGTGSRWKAIRGPSAGNMMTGEKALDRLRTTATAGEKIREKRNGGTQPCSLWGVVPQRADPTSYRKRCTQRSQTNLGRMNQSQRVTFKYPEQKQRISFLHLSMKWTASSGFKISTFFLLKKKIHKVLAFLGKVPIYLKKTQLITEKYTKGFKFYYGAGSQLQFERKTKEGNSRSKVPWKHFQFRTWDFKPETFDWTFLGFHCLLFFFFSK